MKKINAFILISVIIFLCVSLSFAQTDATKSQILIKETSLFKIKMDCFPTNFVVSPDNKRLAYLARRDDGWFVVVDGSEGKVYELIVQGRLMFSPNSKKIAYVATRSDRMIVVIDGVESKEYDWIGNIVFSPNSERVAYTAGEKGRLFLVLDGIAGNNYDDIGVPVFSPDSKRLAYWAQRGEKWIPVLDNAEGKAFDAISDFCPIIFSDDSKRIGYSGKQVDKWLTVIDGKECDGILNRFSSDSKHYFCIKGSGDKAVFVKDDIESEAKYNKITGISVSSDGEGLAYTAMANNKWVVVIDGVESKWYEGVSGSVFSSDNRHIAYWAKRNYNWLTVIDGIEGKEYENTGEIAFSPDGRKYAYWTSYGDKRIIVLSGHTYSAERGGKIVPIERNEIEKEYFRISVPVFSSDSKYVLYCATQGDKWTLNVNDIKSIEKYDKIYVYDSRLFFDSPSTFHALTLRGDEVLYLEARISE